MQSVPALLTVHGFPILNPWRPLNDLILFWSDLGDAAASELAKVRSLSERRTAADAPADIAVQQLKDIQWRLYERHLARYRCRTDVTLAVERDRFIRWSSRHSRHFRNLCTLYPEWFKQYADLTADVADETKRIAHRSPDLERLLREIESHLYQ